MRGILESGMEIEKWKGNRLRLSRPLRLTWQALRLCLGRTFRERAGRGVADRQTAGRGGGRCG